MDLLPTSEQQQIVDSAAAFIGDRLPLRRLKGLPPRAETVSDDTWKQLTDLGWLGLGLAEAAGGVGYGPSEEILLFRELGRVVAPPTILFTAVAIPAHMIERSQGFKWVAAWLGHQLGKIRLRHPRLTMPLLVAILLIATYVTAGLMHNVTSAVSSPRPVGSPGRVPTGCARPPDRLSATA